MKSLVYTFIIHIVFLSLSISVYPTSYNIHRNQISHLGASTLNPEGVIFFSFSLWVLSILIIPAIFFLFRYYKRFMNITSYIAHIAALISSLCLFLLPFFQVPTDYDLLNFKDPHYFMAGCVFILFMVFTITQAYIWLIKMRSDLSFEKNIAFGILYVVKMIIIICFIIFLNTLWEWIYYISMLCYIFCIFIMIADK